jgi:hypothetical protein
MAEPPQWIAGWEPPPGQPASHYAAGLERLLAEAEGPAFGRLQRAARRLQAALPEWESASLARACADLEDSLALVDFGLLQQPGWLARALGGGKRSSREFAQRYEQVLGHQARVKECAAEFAQQQRLRVAAARKPLLDLELETRALSEALVRATAWLESLSASLSHPDGAGDSVLRLAAGAPARLKRLHLLAEASERAAALCRGSGQAGGALAELLEHEWTRAFGAWQKLMRPLAAQPGRPGEPAAQAHKEARRLIHRVHASCSHLKYQDDQLLQGLQALAGE